MSDALREETLAWARALWTDLDDRYATAPLIWALILHVPLDRGNWDVRLVEAAVAERALVQVPEYVPPPAKPWPTPRGETRIVFADLEAAAAAARLLVDQTRELGAVSIGIGFGPALDDDGPAWWAARDALRSATYYVVSMGYPAVRAITPERFHGRLDELQRG